MGGRVMSFEHFFPVWDQLNMTQKSRIQDSLIERQIKKYKKKLIDKKQSAQAFSDLFISEEYNNDDEIRIVKTKRFAVKPMDPEEACVQMELLGHNFYVFLNAETEEVNVVYKRNSNTYGLIEPEF